RAQRVEQAGRRVAARRHLGARRVRASGLGGGADHPGRLLGGGEVVAGEPAEPVGAAAQHDGVPDERERGALEAAGREGDRKSGGGGVGQEHVGGGAGGAHQAASVGGEREQVVRGGVHAMGKGVDQHIVGAVGAA